MALRVLLQLAFNVATTFLFWIDVAHGDPISIGIGVGIDVGLPTLGDILGSFIIANIGTIALIGASLLIGAFQQRPAGTNVFNVKVDAGVRRHAVGKVKVSGQALFGAFAPDGSFWYLVVHCDEELLHLDHVWLDDIEVTLNSGGTVTAPSDFFAVSGGILGIGAGSNPFFAVWVRTWSPSNPVPPPLAAFHAAFPAWTSDHKLAGTTYSIVRIAPVDDKTRPNIYKWQQGAFRLGEPGVQLVATFGRVCDPRRGDDLDNPSTWGSSRNLALLWAWNRYRAFGFAMPMSAIAWDLVSAGADLCDETVFDKRAVPWARYAGGLVFEEDKSPADVEKLILAACDGIVLYDDEGRVYCKVGHWEEPSLLLTTRDILGMVSQTVEDGEAALDGVVVTYTEPDYGYIQQPAAPWYNPRYYVDGSSPNLLQVTIEACQSHNQAVRLAKAIGQAAQSEYRLGPTIGARALLARRERLLSLDYDADFGGAHMLTSPVEIDLESMTGSFAIVPASPTTWDLLAGEEGDRPRRDTTDAAIVIPDATGVSVAAVPVAGSNGNSVRIEATFDAPPSAIYSYAFEFSPDGGATWQVFSTDMPALTALSPILDADQPYEVRWRTVTSGGNYGDYSSPVEVNLIAVASMNFAVIANSQYFDIVF